MEWILPNVDLEQWPHDHDFFSQWLIFKHVWILFVCDGAESLQWVQWFQFGQQPYGQAYYSQMGYWGYPQGYQQMAATQQTGYIQPYVQQGYAYPGYASWTLPAQTYNIMRQHPHQHQCHHVIHLPLEPLTKKNQTTPHINFITMPLLTWKTIWNHPTQAKRTPFVLLLFSFFNTFFNLFS